MPARRSEDRRRLRLRTAIAIGAGLLTLLATPAVAPAALRAHHDGSCGAYRVRLRIGHHRTCLPAKRPHAGMLAQQRAVDRALLATRLEPRHGHHPGRTLRSWLGGSRRGLTALEGALKRGARAHAAGTGGGWKTGVKDDTPDGTTGAVLDVLARKGRAKLTLDTKDTVNLERCPDAAGEVPGTRTRSTSLKIDVPLAHGRKLTVISRQSASAPFTGRTNESAELATVAVGRLKMKASARGELRDANGTVLARLPATTVSAKATLPPLGPDIAWPAVLTDPDTAFVASRALEDARHGGLASLDPLLRSFVVGMQADAWSTYDLARQALLGEQDKLWRGGGCVRVDFYAPGNGSVPTGGHADVRATVLLENVPKHPGRKGIAAFRLTTGVLGGGTVTPAKADTAAQGDRSQSDPVTFSYAAPDEALKATLLISAVSRQGVGTARVPLDVVAAEHYLTVTSVGGYYEENYEVAGDGPTCTYADHERYDLSAPTTRQPLWHVSDLTTTFVNFHQHGTATGSVTCPGPTDSQSCGPRTLDDEGSYYLDLTHPAGSPTATLGFHALGQDYYSGDCASVAKDGGETTVVSHPVIETSVPWSQVVGTQPFAVHVHGSFSDTSHTVTRDYTVTLQPVDSEGRVLG